MNNKAQSKTTLPTFPSCDAWTEAWQNHWRKSGLPGYELPASAEGDFLSQARTPEKARGTQTHQRRVRARVQRNVPRRAGGHRVRFSAVQAVARVLQARARVVLTHGEDGPRETLAQKIQQRFKLKCSLPGMGDTIEL